MSHRKTLSRLTVASLAAAALAAPAATAMPTDPVDTAKDSRQADMHASTVTKPKPAKQDLRTEAAADPSRAPKQHPRLAAPPTRPEHPQPIAPRAQAPLADGGDGGFDVPTLAIVIAGALALGGGLAVTGLRLRAREVH